jgi:hypothetical protein
MLTTLPTLKTRLAIELADPQYDALLIAAIEAVSVRFDRECQRTLARTENFTQEFDPDATEIIAACYPLESVTKFELKTSEAAGWQEIQSMPDYLIRHSCIISLAAPLNFQLSTFNLQLFRVTYTGGYLLPGATPATGQTPLPPDLEQAAVEQVTFWFQTREHIGLKTYWPTGVAYQQFADLDLLPNVRAVLAKYTRWKG